jgi:hypothetical protein
VLSSGAYIWSVSWVVNKFGCPVCLSPALVYPKVLEESQPIVCAGCGAFVATMVN